MLTYVHANSQYTGDPEEQRTYYEYNYVCLVDGEDIEVIDKQDLDYGSFSEYKLINAHTFQGGSK